MCLLASPGSKWCSCANAHECFSNRTHLVIARSGVCMAPWQRQKLWRTHENTANGSQCVVSRRRRAAGRWQLVVSTAYQ